MPPFAVLGAVLANITGHVPPNYVLPNIIGTAQPLNLYVVLVCPPGIGKSSSIGVADDAVVFPMDMAELLDSRDQVLKGINLGSAQGIVHLFRKHVAAVKDKIDTKTGEVLVPGKPAGDAWVRRAAIPVLDEIDTLEKLTDASGNLPNQLKSAWSGATLGQAYVDAEKAVTVPRLKYRLSLIAGAQEAKCRFLLSGEDDGFPQRFVWFPARNDDIDIEDDTVHDEPEPMTWSGMNYHQNLREDETVPFTIPQARAAEIRKDQRRRQAGVGELLDGHRLQLVERIACTFAAAEGRLDVTEHDWQMAEFVMRVSDSEREHVAERMRKADLAQRDAAALRRSDDKVIEARYDAEARQGQINRAAQLIADKLINGPMTRGEARRSLTANLHPVFDDAIKSLSEQGAVTLVTSKADNGRETVRLSLK